MRIVIGTLVFFAAIAATVSSPLAQSQGLRGKSVSVGWVEERMQRPVGMAHYRPAIRHGGFTAYVSSTGRVFSRSSMARGGASGSNDRIGSTGNMSINVQGRTLVAVQHGGSGGARRIEVTFDEGFTACTARVVRGKAEGAGSIIANSTINPGQQVEIGSVKTSGESCSVKAGNAFGNE